MRTWRKSSEAFWIHVVKRPSRFIENFAKAINISVQPRLPLPGLDNQVMGTVTVFQDVTIFKQLNEMKSEFRAVGFP